MAIEYHQPEMEYSIKLNGNTSKSGEGKISLKTNYNNIAITYKCTNQSINKYQVWVTFVEDYPEQKDWGKDIGNCAYDTSIALSKDTDAVANVAANKEIFSKGDGLYRLALCARGDLDNTWDVTEVFFTVAGLDFIPSDADNFETVVADIDE